MSLFHKKGGTVPTYKYRILEMASGMFIIQKYVQVPHFLGSHFEWRSLDDTGRVCSGRFNPVPPGEYASLELARGWLIRFQDYPIIHAPYTEDRIELSAMELARGRRYTATEFGSPSPKKSPGNARKK